MRRVIEHPPEPPPVLEFAAEKEDPGELVRLMWLDSLPEQVRKELPVEDLIGWLLKKYPERNTADVLAGFSGLVFHRDFQAGFADKKSIAYKTTDGEIEASPLILSST
jgi:hypothetical protein